MEGQGHGPPFAQQVLVAARDAGREGRLKPSVLDSNNVALYTEPFELRVKDKRNNSQRRPDVLMNLNTHFVQPPQQQRLMADQNLAL